MQDLIPYPWHNLDFFMLMKLKEQYSRRRIYNYILSPKVTVNRYMVK